MRDILEDDERKVKPLNLLMLTTSALLGGMIIYNAMFRQPLTNQTGSTISMASGASTHVDVAAPAEVSNTVVFKYDATVEEVQRELLASGQFKGLVDGVNGQKTKIAIQQYQQEQGLAVTGEISPELINHIRYTRKVQAAAEFTGSLGQAPSVLPVPTRSDSDIASAQTALAVKGYAPGPITGTMNDATHAAILQFEMDNGLNMDGTIDAPLLRALASGN